LSQTISDAFSPLFSSKITKKTCFFASKTRLKHCFFIKIDQKTTYLTQKTPSKSSFESVFSSNYTGRGTAVLH